MVPEATECRCTTATPRKDAWFEMPWFPDFANAAELARRETRKQVRQIPWGSTSRR